MIRPLPTAADRVRRRDAADAKYPEVRSAIRFYHLGHNFGSWLETAFRSADAVLWHGKRISREAVNGFVFAGIGIALLAWLANIVLATFTVQVP